MVFTDEVRAEICSAVRGFGGSSSSLSLSLSLPKSCDCCCCCCCCCWMNDGRGMEGAKKAVVVEARMAKRASFMVGLRVWERSGEGSAAGL